MRLPAAGAKLALLALVCVSGACRPGAFDDLGRDGSAATQGDAGIDAAQQPPHERDAGEDFDAAADADMAPSGGDAGEAEDDAALGDAAEAPDATEAPDAKEAPDAAELSDAAHTGDAAGPGISTVVLAIQSDQDDALWRNASGGLEELLHFSEAAHGSAGYTIEVGTDGEECRAGLRFALPLEPGSTILEATLRLSRVGPQSNADRGSTLRVAVYETASMGPFDHAHVHQDPAEHVSAGVWAGGSVGGFHVGLSDASTQSPDVSSLVQHVVDRPDWRKGGYIGFLLSPDDMSPGEYAQFRDSFAQADPPTLTLSFRGP